MRNEQTKQIQLPDVYVQFDDAKKNVSTWMNAKYIKDAKNDIVDVSTVVDILQIEANGLRSLASGSPTASERATPRQVSSMFQAVGFPPAGVHQSPRHLEHPPLLPLRSKILDTRLHRHLDHRPKPHHHHAA